MARLLAAVLAILGLLPVANWIAGGHGAPWYSDRLDGWLSGGAIAIGAAVIASIAIRRWPHLWRDGLWTRVAVRWERGGIRADVGLAALVIAIGVVVAHAVLSARPLLIDEIIQVYQARIFATGRLWLPAPAHPEFTSSQHLLDWGGKVFGQFPAGGPALLALGTLVGAEWIVGPLASALCAFLFARLVRRVEPRPGTALAAVLLFAIAPFVVFLGASMMNHITTTAALLAAALALSRATSGSDARTSDAFFVGLALGVAAAIRPLDAAAFAIPTAAWLAWRGRHGRSHIKALLASGIGVFIPVSLLLAVNHAQTGDAFTFGYIAMWGR
ncbi:MAG: glycosyltransferase family 39 protein, partial [Gemmatimonadales bacterium]|nr:glycosyltransferase family 39 protein [Gemmatimonadales bacterium]